MPYLRQASIKTCVPIILVCRNTPGFSTERSTWLSAAKFTITSGFFFFKQLCNAGAVGNIAFYKAKIRILHSGFQCGKITRIGQRVQADNSIFRMVFQLKVNKIAADKSGAAVTTIVMAKSLLFTSPGKPFRGWVIDSMAFCLPVYLCCFSQRKASCLFFLIRFLLLIVLSLFAFLFQLFFPFEEKLQNHLICDLSHSSSLLDTQPIHTRICSLIIRNRQSCSRCP